MACVTWITRLTGSPDRPAVRTVSRAGLLAAAGIGGLYGLAVAPFAALTQHWVDPDDPMLTRCLVLLGCLCAVALTNMGRAARTGRAVQP